MDKGKMLKERRLELGLTLDDLAARTGINRTTINRYENVPSATESMSISNAGKLVQGLQISPYFLLDETDSIEGLVSSFGDVRRISLYKTISADEPINANVETIDTVDVPVGFVDPYPGYIALEINDNTMFPDFKPGDQVLIRLQDYFENGQIAVVFDATGKAIIRRLTRDRNGIVTLEPKNPNYPPKKYALENVKVLGVVTGMLRKI